jgi:hypothetical protein
MSAEIASTTKAGGLQLVPLAFRSYRRETGQSLLLWLILAVLSFATQIVFRREFSTNPGEFGCLNTALGVIGLAAVPLLALNLAFENYFTRDHAPERREKVESLRAAVPFITEIVALAWGALLIPLIFLLLPLTSLSRFSIQLYTLLVALITLGALVSGVISSGRARFWTGLVVAAALVRLVAGGVIGSIEPWAPSGLAAFFLAGVVMAAPLLGENKVDRNFLKAWQAVRDRDFLIHLGATFSVVLAIFLFTSADRIIALSRFVSPNNNFGYVNFGLVDGYQTAGLFGRALLWGTQPLLLLLYVERSRLTKTTAASLRFFWIYLGALVAGAILLILCAPLLSWLFCATDNDYAATNYFASSFVLTMLPLGFIQGLAFFALASRRHPECFVLGGSSLIYLFVLGYFSQPMLLFTFMIGGATMATMLVLFVGVVRWGRRQP